MSTKPGNIRFVILFDDEVRLAAKATLKVWERIEELSESGKTEHDDVLSNLSIAALKACRVALMGAEDDNVSLLLSRKPLHEKNANEVTP